MSDSGEPNVGSDSEYLEGLPRLVAVFGVSLAAFMNVLDSTVAIVALPAISGSLSATPSQASWVLTIYGVCLAVSVPLAGWLATRFGQVRAFVWAVALFTFFSWLCASATTFNELLIFRALQGFSGGVLLPFSQAIVMRIYPPEDRATALGVWGLFAAVAPVAGPVLGGVITDTLGWPWIFYINVPVGFLSIGVCLAMLTDLETETKPVPTDIWGLMLLVVSVVSLQLMLDRGHELDWFASHWIWVLMLIGVCGVVFFLIWELDESHPVVDLSVFNNGPFVVGIIFSSVFYAAYVVIGTIYPLWMQTVLGYTPSGAGWVMAATTLFPLISMGVLGKLLKDINPRFICVCGCLFIASVFYLHGAITTQVSQGYLTVVRFLIGLAMPFFWVPTMAITFSKIPLEQLAAATGLSNFARMLATSLTTAAGISIWDSRTVVHHADLVQAVSQPNSAREALMPMLQGASADPLSGMALLDGMIFQQARTLAMQDVILLGSIMILLLIGMVWLIPVEKSTAVTPQLAHD